MVLVQWQGLHLDETSWEDWACLKELHHLEDKVLFEDRGNVTNNNPEPQASRPNEEGSPRMASGRPRRGSNIPSYLRDYELQV